MKLNKCQSCGSTEGFKDSGGLLVCKQCGSTYSIKNTSNKKPTKHNDWIGLIWLLVGLMAIGVPIYIGDIHKESLKGDNKTYQDVSHKHVIGDNLYIKSCSNSTVDGDNIKVNTSNKCSYSGDNIHVENSVNDKSVGDNVILGANNGY